MKIHHFVCNPFYENTYILEGNDGHVLIVDPGCYEDAEQREITTFIEKKHFKPLAIINTHCHIDHVLGNQFFKERYNIKLWIPKNEKQIFEGVTHYAPTYGFKNYTPAVVDVFYDEKEWNFSGFSFKTIEIPGHSPGHMVLYDEKNKIIIGGDVLFKQSIGRTDLPGGNHDALISHIKSKLYTLPDDVVVYPGHGETTTIGFEKKYNPFVTG